jgi:GDPmannose 4,6-dehydratase
MKDSGNSPATAMVIGASGQDGYFLTERLLDERWKVHAIVRRPEALAALLETDKGQSHLEVHLADLSAPQTLFDLIARERPTEIYNLSGQSSVSGSFKEPLLTWLINADFVATLLECVRCKSPDSRLYQASSTDMFGMSPDGVEVYDENSALNPQSPYASAKAAAHLVCHSYREVYGLRIASGILSNHESHRRPESFLSRKVVGHVLDLMSSSAGELSQLQPLMMGNLKVERDWGFAPDYVEGMCRILRQIAVRAAQTGQAQADIAANYRDYVLATGKTHAVWELVDCAFTIGGFELEWELEGEDTAAWLGYFRSTGKPAVMVDPHLLRTAEPLVIQVDPSRARKELGWAPREGLEVFLQDMFTKLPHAAVAAQP